MCKKYTDYTYIIMYNYYNIHNHHIDTESSTHTHSHQLEYYISSSSLVTGRLSPESSRSSMNSIRDIRNRYLYQKK